MKQILAGRSCGFIGDIDGPNYALLRSGQEGSNWSAAVQGGTPSQRQFWHSQPWSVPGTFKNLWVQILAPTENPASISWDDTQFELLINGASTGLIVTVPAAGPVSENGFESHASDTTHTASIVAGNTVQLVRYGDATLHGSSNNAWAHIAWSVTFESDNVGESSYGDGAGAAGKLGSTNALMGAPFNCYDASFLLVSSGIPNTTAHSIVPCAGNLFRIDVALDTAPGMGATRTFYAILNGVIQDGSGGTVDTTFTITGSATTGHSTFTLPLAVLDLLSVGTSIPTGSPANTAAIRSVGFRATTDGQSALCFHSGNAVPLSGAPSDATDYSGSGNCGFVWSAAAVPPVVPPWRSSRWPATDLFMGLPSGIDPYTLQGFCVNVGSSPGASKTITVTTSKAFTDAAPQVVMTGASGTPSQLNIDPTSEHQVSFLTPTDYLGITVTQAGSATTAAMAWAWLVTEYVAPPIVTTSFPIRRLRRFALPFNGNIWQYISRFELILQAGVGLSDPTAQGYDPIIMFRMSRDGGQTWDNELTMSMGKIGEYQRRAFLNRLGRARNPVVEITSSDPVFVSWLQALIDVTEGTS